MADAKTEAAEDWADEDDEDDDDNDDDDDDVELDAAVALSDKHIRVIASRNGPACVT